MKKLIFSATAFVVALAFASCDKSGNGGDLKITANVENGSALNALIDEVRAIGYIRGEGTGLNVIIATAPFKNGGFTITLPKKIDERLIYPLDFDDMPAGIRVSNKNVAGTSLWDGFKAYKSNEYVGEVWCVYEKETETSFMSVYVEYIFVDADVKITGSYTVPEEDWTENYDVNLKKGWNTVYAIESGDINGESGTMTTKKPDVDLKWHFEGSRDWELPQRAIKKHYFKLFK